MKTRFLLGITALLLFAGSTPAFSQLSAGGTPPSFKFAPVDRIPTVTMPAVNVDSMLAEDAANAQFKDRPFRFGYNHLVYYNTANSGLWTTLRNGDRIWQLEVKTPGSYSINMGFTNFNLPTGAKLFVYSKDHKQILGGFTSANNTTDNFFGTELIYGDEAIIEYYEPATVKGQSNFTLFRVTQGYKDVNPYLKAGFGQAGGCIPNVNCPQCAAYATQKRAVVCVVIGGNEFCSGALINDCLSDGTPYVLTANHCGVADGSWVFRFNWEAPGCAEPDSSPPYQSISGASAIAQDTFSDFNLVKMASTPPANYHAFYAGWSRLATPATSVVCIHHPEGDIKKCSIANNPVTDTIYNAGNYWAKVWQIGLWTTGATEPGSSGSPLFDQNKRIIGQLYGGPSDCGESPDRLRDYFGRFNVSWDSVPTPQTRLKDWLDPCHTDSLTNDGYDPYPVNNSLNIAILNILSPFKTYCQNTILDTVLVENAGTSTITSFIIHYHLNGGNDTFFTWTGNLAPLDTAVVPLPPLTANLGQDTLFASIGSPNDSSHVTLYNDSAISTFIVLSSAAINAPLFQGFEGGIFPPAGWSITTPPSGVTWALSPYGGFWQSPSSAMVNEFSPSGSTAGETPSLITPLINMTHVTGPAYLTFDVSYRVSVPGYYDSLLVQTSTDCGNSWTTIYQKGGDSLATASILDSLAAPASNGWRKDSVNISNLLNDSAIIFKFEMLSGWGNVLYLDNINIADTIATLGIVPVADQMQVKVYPNPFADNFNLQFTLNSTQNVDAALYSADGKKLVTVLNNQVVEAGRHQAQINTQQLSNGIYILKVNERFFKIEKLK